MNSSTLNIVLPLNIFFNIGTPMVNILDEIRSELQNLSIWEDNKCLAFMIESIKNKISIDWLIESFIAMCKASLRLYLEAQFLFLRT